MISSVFFLFHGLIYYIILQSSAIATITINDYLINNGVGNNDVNMPVVTRSRMKILSTSIHEVENKLSSSNISINEISRSIHEHTSSNTSSSALDKPSSTDLSSSITIPITNSSTLVYPSHSSLQVIDLVQGGSTPIEVSKFRISKISNCSDNCLEDCHNFSNSSPFTMESDCEDQKKAHSSTCNGPDITQLFASLSAQMTFQTNSLQDKLSTEFTEVVQAHDKFKQEVRTELDELRALIAQQGSVVSSSVVQNISPPLDAGSSPSLVLPTATASPIELSTSSPLDSSSTSNSLPSGMDIQTQMLTMLTESFSKLSSVILDKNTYS